MTQENGKLERIVRNEEQLKAMRNDLSEFKLDVKEEFKYIRKHLWAITSSIVFIAVVLVGAGYIKPEDVTKFVARFF